jgi:phosphohistidine phosphatase
MKLYLVQHAKAAAKQEDPDRPLTEEGKREVQKVAEFVKRLRLWVDHLWHSGKLRAEQTAEALKGVIEVQATSARDGLGPMDDVAALADELEGSEEHIMVVGHLPFLSKLASLLLTGSESANAVAFKNGGVVSMQSGEDGRWQIDWMVTPELLG